MSFFFLYIVHLLINRSKEKTSPFDAFFADFFSYFGTMSGVLEADPTLFCVSAFNDNGIPAYAHDERRVERSDFFPGLGWMMTRSLWDNELRNKWPKG